MKYNLPINYRKLTQSQRRDVRLQYIELQNNKCFYCGESLSQSCSQEVFCKPIDLKRFPPNFLAHPIHLQHCHKTGLTEGAVHAYCNAVMWQYEGI